MPTETVKTKVKRKSYTREFKLEVTKYYSENNRTSKHYSLNTKTILRWAKDSKKIKDARKGSKHIKHIRRAAHRILNWKQSYMKNTKNSGKQVINSKIS